MNTAITRIRKSQRLLGVLVGLGALLVLSGTTGCATGGSYERSTGESVADRAISERVKAALGEDAPYHFRDVAVSTFNGQVKLRGEVSSQGQKDRAAELAGRVEGVREVVSSITVRQGADGRGNNRPTGRAGNAFRRLYDGT